MQQAYNSQPLTSVKYVLCSGGQMATMVHSLENCQQSAFACEKQNCKCQKHLLGCPVITTFENLIASLQNEKREISPEMKNVFDDIVENYDSLISQISQCRASFFEFASTFGLTQNMVEVVRLLNNGEIQAITCNHIHKIQSQFKKQNNVSSLTPLVDFQQVEFHWSRIQTHYKNMSFYLSTQQQKKNMAVQKFKEISSFYEFQSSHSQRLIKRDKNYNDIPPQINVLDNLVNLDLGYNNIWKIENLSNLKKLHYLDLHKNKILKIENLDNLTNLREIYLSSNKIKKIQNLEKLIYLKFLWLGQNCIEKIENLDNLNLIQKLSLAQNKIEVIENIDHLEKLIEFSIYKNPLKATKKLDQMRTRGVKVTSDNMFF